MWCSNPLKRLDIDTVINEIEKEEYFFEDYNKEEIRQFIEDIRKKEEKMHFVKVNENIQYLRKYDNIDEITNSFTGPFEFITPIRSILNQYKTDYARYQIYLQTEQKKITKNKNNEELLKKINMIQYRLDSFYRKMIQSLSSLSLVNDIDALLSLSSYLIFELNDYTSAYFTLKKCEQFKTKKEQCLLNLIILESKKSNFIRAMILEAEGKYQDAIDAYFECFENGRININAFGRFGRILAVYNSEETVRKEGLRMMKNAALLGDKFSAFHLGHIYLSESMRFQDGDKNKMNMLINKSVEYFKLADDFPDVERELLLSYQMLEKDIEIADYKTKVNEIYYEYS